ncbi:hypothetical protein [Catellatospora chokoriensis]|uniref:Lipoprotein n=1 Tax=Catellatospora chokoriensis TaxID=310353 RepID=A0A8J3KAG4_9ACTN|nr:hypothetical protein [Catellatospora chokoriensis]GIF92434.1 hypothetical protein Cch02nite_58780 [Catellatospora chokoriensis]
MRPDLRRLLGTVLAGLTLAGAAACGEGTPAASPGLTMPAGPATTAGPTATTGAGVLSASAVPAGTPGQQTVPACDAVAGARRSAMDALAPVATALGRSGLSREDLAKATNDLNTAFTAMHTGVAAAAELTADPRLKAKLSAYQLAVEQAIVAVEGSDGEQAKLKAVIDSPAMRSAGNAVTAACA